MKKVGVQLYSVHEDVQKDFHGTLKKLSDIGFNTIEFAGYGNVDCQTMKTWLEDLHLEALSSHVGPDRLLQSLEEEITYLKYLGAKHIVCPSATMNNRAETLEWAERFNQIGKRCAEVGLTFSYHNHASEFQKDQDEYLIDILFANTDSKYVKVQPDVYWIVRGGEDPVKFVKRYADRISLLHCKEWKEGPQGEDSTAVGKGMIDFPALIQLLPNAQCIIEQEEADMDVWEALSIGCRYLKSLN